MVDSYDYYYYIKQDKKEGIFPKILRILLAKRDEVRAYAKTNSKTLSNEEL